MKILELMKMQNVQLEGERLLKIGQDVVRLTQSDDASREEWLKRSKKAMDMALQVVEEKTFPWPDSSNVQYPAITVAALAFHARTLPAILSGNNIVKAKITGKDTDGSKMKSASRVSNYLNYQLLHEMHGWEEGMDRLLLALPIEGCEFKKTYFSPELGTNTSEWIRPEDLIVHYKTKAFDSCPRITHRFWMHPQYIKERQLMGLWNDTNLHINETDEEDQTLQEFYEQHCLLDLDDDGYKEPWCVTVHKDSGKVVRIRADFMEDGIQVRRGTYVYPLSEVMGEKNLKVVRITKIDYFTKYSFIPSPDGGFYDVGLGQIVGPINDSISTIINQIIDAGTWANVASNSGFVVDGVSVKNKRGPVEVKMGEFAKLKLPTGMTRIQDAMMPMTAGGPSAVLFNILGLLITSSKDIAGVQDIHSGRAVSNEKATTSKLRIAEGQKIFSSVFKRIYRALGKEIEKIADLNAIYLDPETYYSVLDTNEDANVFQGDFQDDGTNFQLVADPAMANTEQAQAKAEVLLQRKGDPSFNADEIDRRWLEAYEFGNIDSLIVPPEKRPAPPPDPKLIELDMKAEAQAVDNKKKAAEIEHILARAMEAIANAESKEAGDQLAQYQLELEAITRSYDERNRGMERAKQAGVQDTQGEAAGTGNGSPPVSAVPG